MLEEEIESILLISHRMVRWLRLLLVALETAVQTEKSHLSKPQMELNLAT